MGGVYALTGTTAVGWGGRGGRGCHSRLPGRGGGGKRAAAPGATPRESFATLVSNFEVREDTLKGHVYNIVSTSTSASAFIMTTEEIKEYAGRTFNMRNHVNISLEQMREELVPNPTKPTTLDLSGRVSKLSAAVYKEEVKSYVIDKKLLQSSMQKVYSVIYRKCSAGVRAKI